MPNPASTPSSASPKDRPHDFGIMSFGDHLEDLRKRVILGILGVLPIFLVGFIFGRDILGLLISPARRALLDHGQAASMLQTAPFETFGTVVHIAVVATILVGAPWLLYQLWRFIAPGLYSHERRFVYFLAPLSTVLALTGILFLFFVILPLVLNFFVVWGNDVSQQTPQTIVPPAGMVFQEVPILAADPEEPLVGQGWINTGLYQWRVCIENLPGSPAKILGTDLTSGSSITQQYKISEYVKTVLNMGLGFGLGFQMPVVVLTAGWIGIVGIDMLKKYRRHIFAGCFIAAAFLTPADPASMVLLGGPLYGLFELGLFLLRVFPASRVAGDREHMEDDHSP